MTALDAVITRNVRVLVTVLLVAPLLPTWLRAALGAVFAVLWFLAYLDTVPVLDEHEQRTHPDRGGHVIPLPPDDRWRP